MSGVLKTVAKVFKKIVKVAIKIAPYALAVAAVVFTGGAALGILPTFGAAVGGLVSSLGMSAALTGALTGAITSAGFGAALGFVTGGKKGLQKGALMGALTGGVLGAINPATFGIVKSATGALTTTHALASQAANIAKGIAPVDLGVTGPGTLSAPEVTLPGMDLTGGVAATNPAMESAQILGEAAQQGSAQAVAQAGQGIAPLQSAANVNIGASAPGTLSTSPVSLPGEEYLTTPATGVSAATAQSGGNILNSLLGGQGGVGSNLTGLVGSVLQSIGGNKDTAVNQIKQEEKQREKFAQFGYGGVYTGHPNLLSTSMPGIPQPRYYYDKNTNEIVDRQQPQGA